MEKNTGADVTWDGKRCKAAEFTSRKRYQCDDAEKLRISALSSVKFETIPDIDNPDKYEWYEFVQHYEQGGMVIMADTKYGRYQYCPRTGIKRTITMGEFYGNGVVD